MIVSGIFFTRKRGSDCWDERALFAMIMVIVYGELSVRRIGGVGEGGHGFCG